MTSFSSLPPAFPTSCSTVIVSILPVSTRLFSISLSFIRHPLSAPHSNSPILELL